MSEMRPKPESSAEPPAPVPVGEASDVAIILDLATRDGRRAVEVRRVTELGNGYFASARATIYSCSYSTLKERILALQRARWFCELSARRVVQFCRAERRRASWQ